MSLPLGDIGASLIVLAHSKCSPLKGNDSHQNPLDHLVKIQKKLHSIMNGNIVVTINSGNTKSLWFWAYSRILIMHVLKVHVNWIVGWAIPWRLYLLLLYFGTICKFNCNKKTNIRAPREKQHNPKGNQEIMPIWSLTFHVTFMEVISFGHCLCFWWL